MNLLLKLSELYDDERFSDGVCIDLRGLEGTNSYCTPEAALAIERALEPWPLAGIHWIDSGDYHYLSEIFLRKADRDFALALLDNHSDEQQSAFGPGLASCGSWVSELLSGNPHIKAHARNNDCIDLPSELPLYVSIDLDVLSPEYARTNWDQGTMSLSGMKELLAELAGRSEIMGIDICGGLTIAKGATVEDLSVNLRTRRELLSFLTSLIPRSA